MRTADLLLEVLEGPEHQGERCAEFVTDIGEERRLGAIDFRQRLSALALVIPGARLGNRGADLARHQLVKITIQIIKCPVRAHSSDHHPGKFVGLV